MAAVRKKQEDKQLKALREIGALNHNRECFDCGQRGPTYINMTIGSFICSKCSGVMRGLTPPHRVKSISMATFTEEELDFIRAHGNEECAKTWLGLLSDAKRVNGGRQNAQQDYREHIIDKYEKQRYYLQPASPLKSIGAATGLRNGNGGGTGSLSGGSGSSTTSPSSSSSAGAPDQNNNNTNSQLNLKAIQLTPPAPSRTSGRHHHHQLNNLNNSNGGGSRGLTSANAFAEDSLFSELSTRQQVHQQQQPQNQWANSNNNSTNNINNNNHFFGSPAQISNGQGFNGTSSKSVNNNNSLVSDPFGQGTHSANLPGMATGVGGVQQPQQLMNGGGGGFVADFDSADIFNATVISGRNVGGVAAPKELKRSNAVKRRNGSLAGEGAENFADFEHNSIFNSAEYNMRQPQQEPQPIQQIPQQIGVNGNVEMAASSNYTSTQSPFCQQEGVMFSRNNGMESPGWGGGGRGSTIIPFDCNSSNSGSFVQPINNFWQQQPNCQWHPCYQNSSPFAEPYPINVHPTGFNTNSNRWSVPMSMSSSNSSMASTPSADRYAALKDLDEQIREIKEKEVVVVHPPASPFSNPNPFKAAAFPQTNFPTKTNPFNVEPNGIAHQPVQPVHFNGFGSSFGIGLNITGGAQRSNNPFL